jgi:hypothetical protein
MVLPERRVSEYEIGIAGCTMGHVRWDDFLAWSLRKTPKSATGALKGRGFSRAVSCFQNTYGTARKPCPFKAPAPHSFSVELQAPSYWRNSPEQRQLLWSPGQGLITASARHTISRWQLSH